MCIIRNWLCRFSKRDAACFAYPQPTILDLGPIETLALETCGGNACYGASGISHCMAAPLLPICAVANAIGKWIAPPAAPDKALKDLGKC